ncbi:sensor histidine kinase [Streptomyces sp. A7024]|uniref:histidine kinase n=1 Tax=Streptomyces coryli TaxID=1128680 RepID=A0A6G4TYT0_9ACTN|nr:sensor histidine kinase [Streptomyces coryli]
MQRVYDFLRRHPTLVDSFWAVVLVMMSLLWVVTIDETQQRHNDHQPHTDIEKTLALGFSVAFAICVALRRRSPERVLLATIAIGVLQLGTDVGVGPAHFALVVIVFTAASRGTRWASRLALAASAVAPTISSLRWPDSQQTISSAIAGTIFMTITFVLAWVLGDSIRTRRAYYAELEERARRLEKEREAQSRVAVAAERARIARELHDVVAHNVSVMVVQADGAAYVLDQAPDQAKQALGTISSTGRQALTEMRRLLGVLRTDGTEQVGEYVPQPGVDQLTDLVEQVRGTGITVDFKVDGTPRELPSSIELTAYRIVQEALTNTRKHGGPNAGATVRLTYGDSGVELLVEDDGRGAERELVEEGGADGLGHGLIGMRERVGMVGGRLETGPRPGGGFRITALLPLKPAT